MEPHACLPARRDPENRLCPGGKQDAHARLIGQYLQRTVARRGILHELVVAQPRQPDARPVRMPPAEAGLECRCEDEIPVRIADDVLRQGNRLVVHPLGVHVQAADRRGKGRIQAGCAAERHRVVEPHGAHVLAHVLILHILIVGPFRRIGPGDGPRAVHQADTPQREGPGTAAREGKFEREVLVVRPLGIRGKQRREQREGRIAVVEEVRSVVVFRKGPLGGGVDAEDP